MSRRRGSSFLLSALLVMALASLLVAPAATAAERWRGPWSVATGAAIGGHGLASAGSTLHVVYARTDAQGHGRLVYRRSQDRGHEWSSETTLWSQSSSRLLFSPTIEARGRLVVVVFRTHDATTARVSMRMSHNAG